MTSLLNPHHAVSTRSNGGGEGLEVVADIVSHGAELEAADHARATAALSAHHIAGGSISGAATILSILLLQVSKVTWQYV